MIQNYYLFNVINQRTLVIIILMRKTRPLSVHYSSQSNRKNKQKSLVNIYQDQKKRSHTHDRSFTSAVRFKPPIKNSFEKKVSFQSDRSDNNKNQIKLFRASKIKAKTHRLGSNIQLAQENKTSKIFQRNAQDNRSFDAVLSRPRFYRMYSKKFNQVEGFINPSQQEQKYNSDLTNLSELYIKMQRILRALQQQNTIDKIQPYICEYREFLGSGQINIIDQFLLSLKDRRLWQTLRACRIHQALSISYLFLQIAQGRFIDNQSYLINFIGFCTSNIRLLTRLYILLNKHSDFKFTEIQNSVYEWELQSFGHNLGNMQHVILRIQHNNQILTMIHKRLGRNNTRFEKYIIQFIKVAERKNHPTSLCAHYIFQYMAMYIHQEFQTLLGISKTLEIAPIPYLAKASKQYTLIFQPIGIIKDINVKNVSLRPYIMQFMKWASKHFDIVLWTWQMPSQIENLEQLFQPYLFSKLYRYHCIYENQIYVKDLNRLNRDLQKTLIIDYDERIFSKQPHNGIVCRWKNRNKDKGLLILSQILEEMINNNSTIQQTLSCYQQQINSIHG